MRYQKLRAHIYFQPCPAFYLFLFSATCSHGIGEGHRNALNEAVKPEKTTHDLELVFVVVYIQIYHYVRIIEYENMY